MSTQRNLVLPACFVALIGAGLGITAWENLRRGDTAATPDATSVAAAATADAVVADPANADAPSPTRRAPAPRALVDDGIADTRVAGTAGPAVDPQRELEEQFVAEPISASWAQFNEQQVRATLAPEALAAEGLERPVYYDVECRTSLCRIDLVTQDGDVSTLTELRVLQGISASLGTATLFHEPQADGTIALVIYARANE